MTVFSPSNDEISSTIHLLPIEILTQIFLRTSLSDRNNIRLVCREWYDACNHPFILGLEKWRISGQYKIDEIIFILLNSEKKLINLEFRNIRFTPLSASFWHKIGHKIRVLCFIDCDLDDQNLENLILACTRLIHLSWKYDKDYSNTSLWSLKVLDNLLEKNIRRKSLIYLEIHVCRNRSLSNYLLSGIFTLFPNIRHFCFFYPLDRGFNSLKLDKEGKRNDLFTFSSIFNKLKFSACIMETLKLGSPLCAGFDWKSISILFKLTSLKDIEINDDILHIPENLLTAFLLRQRHLQSIKCTIRYTDARDFICRLLECLLINCTQLKNLELVYNGMININETIIELISKSQLESLCIRCMDVYISIPNKPYVNKQLRALILGPYGVESYRMVTYAKEEYIRLALLRTFRNLFYLEMNLVTDAVLQGIWKYQKNLKTLKLKVCSSCTNKGFIGFHKLQPLQDQSNLSISNLRGLQYLELEMTENQIKYLTNKLFLSFYFPDLKYLRISFIGNYEFYQNLFTTISYCIQLQGINLSCQKVPYNAWIELCSNLKNLRYLCILGGHEDRNFSRLQYENIFKYSSSLRVLVHRTNKGWEKYYYDFINSKVLKKSTTKTFSIPSEKYESFFVNWLSF